MKGWIMHGQGELERRATRYPKTGAKANQYSTARQERFENSENNTIDK